MNDLSFVYKFSSREPQLYKSVGLSLGLSVGWSVMLLLALKDRPANNLLRVYKLVPISTMLLGTMRL